MIIPEFKKVQDEAKFRLDLKRELKKRGLILTKEMTELPTEELLRIKEKMDSVQYLGKFQLNDEELKQRIGKGKILTHVSLFTGCGGLDLGFSQAGIQTRVMIEWNHSACETLRHNWLWENLKERRHWHYETKDGKIYEGPVYVGDKSESGEKLKYVEDELVWKNKEEFLKEAEDYYKELERRKQSNEKRDDDYQFAMSCPPATWYHEPEPVIMERDIREVSSAEILEKAKLQVGECSIISGGFPCQGFSLAGKRVIDDPRNSLYKEFVRIVRDLKPAKIIGENVPGLVSMGKGEVIKQICEDFAECGYDIAWDILDASHYGVPQKRKRVILIGQRVDAVYFDGEGNPSITFCAGKGKIEHPKLFYDRLKRWGKLKNE